MANTCGGKQPREAWKKAKCDWSGARVKLQIAVITINIH